MFVIFPSFFHIEYFIIKMSFLHALLLLFYQNIPTRQIQDTFRIEVRKNIAFKLCIKYNERVLKTAKISIKNKNTFIKQETIKLSHSLCVLNFFRVHDNNI